jgi:hypothetical protein
VPALEVRPPLQWFTDYSQERPNYSDRYSGVQTIFGYGPHSYLLMDVSWRNADTKIGAARSNQGKSFSIINNQFLIALCEIYLGAARAPGQQLNR